MISNKRITYYAVIKTGQNITQQDGTALEAMVAAVTSISVVYPHMDSLGGDDFWLISETRQPLIDIDASETVAQRVNLDFYTKKIESCGPRTFLNMAGAASTYLIIGKKHSINRFCLL